MEKANKREPLRTCVGCRTRFPQRMLARFVKRDAPGEAAWERDPPGIRRPGRGAYLCSAECVGRVRKNRRYPGLGAVGWPPDPRPMYDRTAHERPEQTRMK